MVSGASKRIRNSGGAVFQGKPAKGVRLSVRKVLARVISRSITRIVSRFMPPRDVDDVVQETYVRLCHASGASVATTSRIDALTLLDSLPWARIFTASARSSHCEGASMHR